MLLCPRCHRANPDEAAFCHFDGAELRHVNGEASGPRLTRLPHEFVFPSGRRCQSYDELVLGCQAEWNVARDLLRDGVFRQYLTSVGRMDLAKAAREPVGATDLDAALEAFLAQLPARIETNARLDLNPRRIQVGPLHVGESRQVQLTVLNHGTGFLRGTLAVLEGDNWLVLENGKSGNECLIRCRDEQRITLRIDTRGLAAPHRHFARLTVITNGGVAEIPVRLDLEARPFEQAPFQGVSSPREMAERMREAPKAAVPLLESGAVALWFAENGWTYPLLGPAARGVAAVQQFFEGMGLSRPPTVQLAQSEINLECARDSTVSGLLTLRTDSRKWIYARAESGAAWLTIDTPAASGPQQSVIEFTVHGRLLPDTPTAAANVRVLANSGQTLTSKIHVVVQRRNISRTASLTRPIFVGATTGLLARLILALPADLWARVWSAQPRPGMVAGSLATWLVNPLGDPHFLRQFVLATWWIGGMLYGLALWRRTGPRIDLVAGLIAGSAAGLVGAATVACALCGLDGLPRWALATLIGPTERLGSSWVGTALWIFIAALSWAVWGSAFGVVFGLAARASTTLRLLLSAPVAELLILLGLKKAASHFVA